MLEIGQQPLPERDEIRSAIASEVRAQAARKSLSHQEVADRAGIARSTFANKAAGKSGFSVEELVRVARAIDVPTSVLLAAAIETEAASA